MRDERLWGWDPTPGIVSVWAEPDGRAWIWRRCDGHLVRERASFRPWIVLSSLDDLAHLGERLVREAPVVADDAVTHQVLEGPGELRYLVRARDGRALEQAVLRGAGRRLGRQLSSLRQVEDQEVIALPPEEQYLVASGRTYFRDLSYDEVHRAQFDLETTGLSPERSRIFLIAVRDPSGGVQILETDGDTDEAEARLLRAFAQAIQACDPDVIENHNLHGFDLPFLVARAERLGVPLVLGRGGGPGPRLRPAARGASFEDGSASTSTGDDADAAAASAGRAWRPRRARYTVPGRELLDSLDAVRRFDFATRELPGHGLKAVARHLGLATASREYVPGAEVHAVFRRDPERVRRYARDDVEEAAAVARTLGGAAFALAKLVPRRYERLGDAGAATGILEPLLVRAYLRAGTALPAHQPSDGTPHQGAALHLFAAGVASRVVKADVASLYPSLMRAYRIGPARDHLGALLALVDDLVERRLAAKARARASEEGSAARHQEEASSAAMKLVVNSAYGYLAAGTLTRFSDVHAANEVTRRGRLVLSLLCRELAARGATLLEADTDGVYFAVPESWTEADERRVVAEVDALLPPLVQLQFDGRYAAMLSHEPKNYALLGYDGELVLRGVAFRSSRAEPFGEAFLRRALARLLRADLPGVQAAYLETIAALRRRALPTFDVTARVRLNKTAEEYQGGRGQRREASYEAMLQSGLTTWRRGAVVRIYRAANDRPAVLPGPPARPDGETAPEGGPAEDPRDYDIEYYERLLRTTFASRLAAGLRPEDFAEIFTDPDQLTLFSPALGELRPILTPIPRAFEGLEEEAPTRER
ncbi:MAG: ribonuclease H-like domain-containing protein [Kofleriaceae bacterium]